MTVKSYIWLAAGVVAGGAAYFITKYVRGRKTA